MKVVFASYNNQPGYQSPEEWVEKINKLADLMAALAKHCPVEFVQHIGYNGLFTRNGVEFHFLFTEKKDKHRLPGRMNRMIKQMKPDIVIVSGLIYPLQVIQLRWLLGKNVKIIARHHADKAPKGFRRMLQKSADSFINAYLFTSLGNAGDWIAAGIIKNKKKILELPAASTEFSRMDRTECKEKLGMSGDKNFLWVGRLNANKDPMTVLMGFERYLLTEPNARLFMIFQEADLLKQVEEKIGENKLLTVSVHLVGQIPHDQLREWYSAADHFISGSHNEGGSYALLEAMACGCIPIVTAIPAALKMIDDGKYGIIFKPGDANDLADKLIGLYSIDQQLLSESIEKYFREILSSEAIAAKLYDYCKELLVK